MGYMENETRRRVLVMTAVIASPFASMRVVAQAITGSGRLRHRMSATGCKCRRTTDWLPRLRGGAKVIDGMEPAGQFVEPIATLYADPQFTRKSALTVPVPPGRATMAAKWLPPVWQIAHRTRRQFHGRCFRHLRTMVLAYSTP
jgi:hypothetical protein